MTLTDRQTARQPDRQTAWQPGMQELQYLLIYLATALGLLEGQGRLVLPGCRMERTGMENGMEWAN